MTQISKYPISKNVADRIFEVFIKTLVKIKDKKEAQDFAYDLFSPTEKVMLAKRIAIAFLLMKGYQYREISKLLQVSSGTVASVNLSIRLGKNGYKTVLGRITKEEKLEEFFTNVAEKLLSVGTLQTKGSAWRYMHNEVKRLKHKKSKEC